MMTPAPVVIIENPSNLGLKEPEPFHEPGVKKMPDHFRKYGFHTLIKATHVYRLAPPAYDNKPADEVTGVRNTEKIVVYAKQQADLLTTVLAKKEFPVVLGGDCSILIGNALALKRHGNYGLFFLDGHTDFITPALSQTGGAAGMDLAIVAGLGHASLTNMAGAKPYFEEEHIWCIGNREYDEDYEQPVKNSGVFYKDLAALRTYGLERCASEFLQMVDANRLDGFWIHIDADVLDDAVMPAVDSRQPGGLTYDEFKRILSVLFASDKLTGMEITILDPELDADGGYTHQFIAEFCGIFNGAPLL